MKSSRSKAIRMALPLSILFTSVLAQNSGLKPLVYSGCYTDPGDMTNIGSYTYQTPGYCQQQCVNQNKPVMGTNNGGNCYCGDLLPDPSTKASDSTCNVKCNGYAQDMCGGSSSWSVQLTGLSSNVDSVSSSSTSDSSNSSSNTNPNANAPSSSSTQTPTPTTSTTKGPSVVTHASTIVVTAPGEAAPRTTVINTTSVPAKAGPNVAGIVAGVVVAIVVLSTLAGGIFFFLRNRRKRAVEEEYRRNVANNYNGNVMSSSAGSVSDSRLEPSFMMQRRQSDGSIADNHDYSRRILKVTNPGGL